ncbi:MAG: hypothetical protein PUI85_01145 [Eubacteriales bacterium]|nr:hypothetical protein [Eubacteriales bacterium]MDY3333005.1 hypothetical protein [Gallibacter sp.]
MTLPLDADLKLGDNTGNDTIVVEKTDTMDFVGVLNVKAIKEQMAQIQGNHQGANPDEISLENLNTTFTAKLNLPKELKFEKTEPVLEGADSVFKIEGITKENDGKTAVVTFKLINAENIKTFAQLRDKINSVNDELKVVFKTAKFDNTANTNIDYEVTGSITGNLTAEATNKATGTIINFNLTWNGKQSDAGKSNSNPDAIALSVRHEGPVVIKDKIYGDLLINDDTQHDKVIELAKRDAFKVTGLLNVAPIKAQMKKIQEQYQNGNLATNLKISDMKNEFTASINLPDGLEFTNNVKEKIVLSGAKNHFKISKTELDEKKLTVTLTLTNEAKTFEDILTAVNGVEDDLKVEVDGVKFTDKSSANTNFTIQGDVSGLFEAKVTNVLSSKVMNFNFAWSGVQMRGGEDSTAPTSDKITATVKHNTNTISAEGELEGDLLVNNDTQHNDVYTVKMNDKMILTGLLNVKPIKEQLDQLVKAYPSANTPENIKVENVDTSFTATMTLPKELKLVDGDKTIIELVGANDKFKITDKKVEGNTVTVKMSLVKKAETFKDIKDAVEGVDNDLRVNVQGVMFDTTKAKPDTNYTINGTVGGNFKAMAINTLGKTIDFDYTWKGVQKKDGEDSTNPNSKDITLTLKYQKPTTQDVKIPTQILPGDILVGDDTEHDKVFETLQGKKVAFTGSLDVSSVKQQMEKIKRMYGKSDQDAEDILISDYSSVFEATLTLPEEMDFDANPVISLLNDNGKFKIVDTKVEGKTVKVSMTVKKEVKTFADLQDAVLGMEDKLNVLVDGAKFNEKAKPDTNYTVRGTMTGQLKAKATYALSGNVINFDLTWNAEQSKDGADAINPTSKDITFTLKYKANENPQTPNNGENSSKPDTPKNDKIQKKTTNNVKTNDLSNIVLYSGIMIISLLGMVVVLYGRKLFQKR